MAEKTVQEVQRWLDRINISRQWRKQVAEENNWEKLLEQVKNKYDVILGNTMVPPIAEMFAYKDAVISNLFYRAPYIAVNAKTTGSIMGAYILESAVNYYWRELKLNSDVELEIIDALFVGHAWNKTGTNIKTSGSGDQLKLEKDQLFSNRVSWKDMYMNVGCLRPTRDNLWIAQCIYRPTEDVKKDYGRPAAKIKGSTHPSVDAQTLRTTLYKDDVNYTKIYEIWSAYDKKIYLVCDEVNFTYLEDPKPWPDWLEEYPYEFLSFHDLPDEPYPQSDAGQFEPQVKEKIKVFTQALNHIKRWNRQMVIKKNTMGSSELDKFEKGIDGAILSATVTGDIQTAIKMVDFGSLPPDIYMILDRLDATIRKINGMPEFAYGGATKTSSRTEGELQLIKGGADARTDRKQNRIERHCENIARHMIAQMKNQFFVPTFSKITGNEPAEIIKAFADRGMYDPTSQTIKFDSDDIKGEYEVSVKSGSTLPMDKITRDKVLDQVLQMGAQLAAVPNLPPFMSEVIKERLRDYDIKSLEQAFDQQLQDQEQSKQNQQASQDIESQKVIAETQKRQAQAQQINVDTVIKGAQAVGKASDILPPETSLTR